MISFIKRNDVANAQGLYAVRLRICKERQRRYFSLNIFADNEYWDEENECFRILKNVRDKKQKEENHAVFHDRALPVVTVTLMANAPPKQQRESRQENILVKRLPVGQLHRIAEATAVRDRIPQRENERQHREEAHKEQSQPP